MSEKGSQTAFDGSNMCIYLAFEALTNLSGRLVSLLGGAYGLVDLTLAV